MLQGYCLQVDIWLIRLHFFYVCLVSLVPPWHLQVYMPNGTSVVSASCPNPKDPNSGVSCAGYGLQPYITSVSDPQNYGAKVMFDPIRSQSYFIAMAIEWLDRSFYDSCFIKPLIYTVSRHREQSSLHLRNLRFVVRQIWPCDLVLADWCWKLGHKCV